MARANGKSAKSNGAVIGFEAKLWQAADKLRNNMDAAEYKHVVLGLIFLKYISDSFEEVHAKLSVLKSLHRYEVRFSREFIRHLQLYESRRERAVDESDFSKRTESTYDLRQFIPADENAGENGVVVKRTAGLGIDESS